ncbi:hypothetical protein N7536_011667 [Penicillium majusculum]|nr:hypothetical protein N7536_011667 [Penicillium majusculum]
MVLMAGFNLCDHRIQDFYPDQVGMEATQPTVVTVVGQTGALIDGYTIGHIGTFFGRRSTMLMSCVLGSAIAPAYILPQNMSLAACALLEQFLVDGLNPGTNLPSQAFPSHAMLPHSWTTLLACKAWVFRLGHDLIHHRRAISVTT